jgi:precorrin-2 dehydrogenase/sirohydrochlorin ferrochelatase
MRYYPIFLDLKGVPCLVVGGGQVGERKIKTLQTCGAKIFLVSRELTPYLEKEIQHGRVELLAQDYQTEHLEGKSLIIGATDDPDLNGKVGQEARTRGLLCNIVDKPKECSFILPSLVTRGDLTIAVSTAGNSPALAKKIRQDLEERFPEIYGPYLEVLGKIRREILSRNLPAQKNPTIFQAMIQAPILTWMETKEEETFYDFLDRLVDPPIDRFKLNQIWNESLDSLP